MLLSLSDSGIQVLALDNTCFDTSGLIARSVCVSLILGGTVGGSSFFFFLNKGSMFVRCYL